jgi:hypothetical protein
MQTSTARTGATDYRAIAIEGARSMAKPNRPANIEQLRERITEIVIPVVQSKPTPRADETDIVISRELAKEILEALDGATRFGAHVGAIVQRSDVSEWGDSVRTGAREAACRLRRAAMAQEDAA